MKIKRNILIGIIALLLAALFNVLAFWFTEEYIMTFWISFGFANFALVVLVLSYYVIARKKRQYLEYQNATLIGSYYLVCNIYNIAIILLKYDNMMINLLINIVLLIVYLIILFVFLSANADTTSQLANDEADRNEFYKLKDRAKQLLNKSNSREINKKLENLYDRICSCQISKNISEKDTVLSIENNINIYLGELLAMLKTNRTNGINEKIALTIELINKRDDIITNSIKR